MKLFKSDFSGNKFPLAERVSGKTIRSAIMELIRHDNPNFEPTNYLSITELNLYREKYISNLLSEQIGELNKVDRTVLRALADQTTLADKVKSDANQTSTFGQRVADRVASFGGSWTFIISFGLFISVWIMVNMFWLVNKGFDPYPFILLNLILSCLAALQAPVIMMSQNRQEEKDRERAQNDYMINLKSEVEIRMLHEKIDHLIIHQQQELLEIQKVQIDMMNDILDRIRQR